MLGVIYHRGPKKVTPPEGTLGHRVGLRTGYKSYTVIRHIQILVLKGTSNYLAELKNNNIETDSQIFLNVLNEIRGGKLSEIDVSSLCSFLPRVSSQTWWNLTLGFYGKYLIVRSS